MPFNSDILSRNRAWAAASTARDPLFFDRLENIQKPAALWIGCSDSRVAANVITGTEPGEMFVHRNIANMVVNTDLNMLSVLQYAVEVLQIEHVIVCGHYGCGGIAAAMTHQSYGIINKWLRNIKDAYRLHRDEVDAIADLKQREDRMVELNVQEQVVNLMKTSVIQRAWRQRQVPHLHGWVYSLHDGLLKSVYDRPAGSEIPEIYRYDDPI